MMSYFSNIFSTTAANTTTNTKKKSKKKQRKKEKRNNDLIVDVDSEEGFDLDDLRNSGIPTGVTFFALFQ
jgi:hypothetical protein